MQFLLLYPPTGGVRTTSLLLLLLLLLIPYMEMSDVTLSREYAPINLYFCEVMQIYDRAVVNGRHKSAVFQEKDR